MKQKTYIIRQNRKETIPPKTSLADSERANKYRLCKRTPWSKSIVTLLPVSISFFALKTRITIPDKYCRFPLNNFCTLLDKYKSVGSFQPLYPYVYLREKTSTVSGIITSPRWSKCLTNLFSSSIAIKLYSQNYFTFQYKQSYNTFSHFRLLCHDITYIENFHKIYVRNNF